MLLFRIRDQVSILFYRLNGRAFKRLGRAARIVWPLRIVGAQFCDFGQEAVLQYGAYVAVLPVFSDTPALTVGPRTQIGNHAHIIVTHSVVIGESVLVADRLFIADNAHEFADPSIPVRDQGLRRLPAVQVGDGAWIGENVCIVGASVGNNSVIGANSVVTRDIPAFCVAAGAPAIVIKRFCFEQKAWRRTCPEGEFVDAT